MSRLYLILLFCSTIGSASAQNMLGKYLDFADEQYQKGDYVYALTYYEKALEIDSNSVDILWKYAETLRAYKDYAKAAYYYQKIYSQEEANIHPGSLLQWALMEKQQGNYETAIDLFKRAKKKYVKNKKDYLYLKSKRELESCLWAQSAQKDTSEVLHLSLPEGLNTPNSEFGHVIADSVLVLSSLRADSIGLAEEVYDPIYTNQLYTFPIFDSLGGQTELIKSLKESGINTGNGTFSLDGKRFYFSKCSGTPEQKFTCGIAVARYENGKWKNPELLGDAVNEPGVNNTMPHIALVENEETLFFCSDRVEKKENNGMDIYLVTIKNNGNQFGKVRQLPKINSIDNELSPYFDAKTKRLYFSSSWWNGFGGYDVFYTEIVAGNFSDPVNLGLPVNSPANDVYYFLNGDTSYVSSNRLGVEFAKNPTCCSDIFAFTPPDPEVIIPETKRETLADLNKRLPVTLYFHNDVPGPQNYEPHTTVNYMDSYNAYTAMLPEYRKEYAKGLSGDKVAEAEEDIESFFAEYVDQGVRDLNLFKSLLLEELHKGYRIRLSVRGFASPLAKTEYNVALTGRRINSLINHLKVSNGGAFAPYLNGTAANGGKLEIVGVPFGEYTADKVTSDNPNDQKNSVFSRAAARERKIEIQSVSYLDTDSLFFLVDLEPTSIILGKVNRSESLTKTLRIFNSGKAPLTLSRAMVQDSAFVVSFQPIVAPGSSMQLTIAPTRTMPAGLFSVPMELYFEGYERPIRVMILGEGL